MDDFSVVPVVNFVANWKIVFQENFELKNKFKLPTSILAVTYTLPHWIVRLGPKCIGYHTKIIITSR
jgi:hypothetical protein